jgi:hypothetical protein
MNQNTAPQRNGHHQPETVSTASLQDFEDPPGGLPLDSPIVQARQQLQHGRPAAQQANVAENDMPKESP